MNMSLAYRIVHGNTCLPGYIVPGSPAEREARTIVEVETGHIKHAVHMRISNVAKLYAEHEQQKWDLKADLPNIAPPFDKFWVEWDTPGVWNLPEGIVRKPDQSQFGGMVAALDMDDNPRGSRRDSMKVIFGGEGREEAIDRSKWAVSVSFWCSDSRRPLVGRAMWLGLDAVMFVNKTGQYEAHCFTGPAVSTIFGADAETFASALHIIGLGMSFCHCKNVAREEHDDDRGERWHRRTRVPVLKYYVLNIDPMRQTLRTEGGLGEGGLVRALHICRGHFATYTEDHPLFGKYVGTFWRPQHVRGHQSAGVVTKDYGVKVPLSPDTLTAPTSRTG